MMKDLLEKGEFDRTQAPDTLDPAGREAALTPFRSILYAQEQKSNAC
jgi:hypothetical protein